MSPQNPQFCGCPIRNPLEVRRRLKTFVKTQNCLIIWRFFCFRKNNPDKKQTVWQHWHTFSQHPEKQNKKLLLDVCFQHLVQDGTQTDTVFFYFFEKEQQQKLWSKKILAPLNFFASAIFFFFHFANNSSGAWKCTQTDTATQQASKRRLARAEASKSFTSTVNIWAKVFKIPPPFPTNSAEPSP